MKRRGFLGLLGAVATAPFVVNAELWEHDEPPYTFPEATIIHPLGGYVRDGCTYRYIKAHRTLEKGDVVCVREGVPLGIAMGHVDAGNCGFVQVGGPAAVRFAVHG